MAKNKTMSVWGKDYEVVLDNNKEKTIPIFYRKIRPKNYKYIDKTGKTHSIVLWLYILPTDRKHSRYWHYAIEIETSKGEVVGYYNSIHPYEYGSKLKKVEFKTIEDAKTAVMNFYKIWLSGLSNIVYHPNKH